MGRQFEEDPADISHLYKRQYLKIQKNKFFFLSSQWQKSYERRDRFLGIAICYKIMIVL